MRISVHFECESPFTIDANTQSALKNQKGFKNEAENLNKQPINNVIAITPFLKRDAGFDGGFSA